MILIIIIVLNPVPKKDCLENRKVIKKVLKKRYFHLEDNTLLQMSTKQWLFFFSQILVTNRTKMPLNIP